MEERTLSTIASSSRNSDDENAALPRLSVAQAKYLSYVIEHGWADAIVLYADAEGNIPDTAAWSHDPEYLEAVRLFGSDRRTLWRAMTLTLFGPAYRALLIMLENPKTAAKGIELLSRTHGILIDRVRQEEPGQVQALLRALSENRPVPGPGQRYSIIEGEFRDAAALP